MYKKILLKNGLRIITVPQKSTQAVAVLPLVKNNAELVAKAREVYAELKKHFMCQYDEVGTIGRRYRRQDEIGTPACITVDHQTLEDNTTTIRDRDTMAQERIGVSVLE